MRPALFAAALLVAGGLVAGCSPAVPAEDGAGASNAAPGITVEAAAPEPAPVPPGPPPAAPEPAPAGAASAGALQGLWAGEERACQSGEAIRFTATEYMTEGDGGSWELSGDALTLRSDGADGGDVVETNLVLVEATADRLVWRDFAGQDHSFVRCAPEGGSGAAASPP